MTCIVGVVENDIVWIGGDSAAVAGYEIHARADRKVFRNGPFLFGFTTSFRMGQLLHYAFAAPAHPDDMDVERFMATTFVDAVRACLKQGGYARKEAEQESGGVFLVGYRGRLFVVMNDYQVGELMAGYHAVGSGSNLALGALHATADLGLAPQERIIRALSAAEAYNSGVRGPFHIEMLEPARALVGVPDLAAEAAEA
jgi:ATP-dependent protease HslVU (ClpYQ) peptidase subunit